MRLSAQPVIAPWKRRAKMVPKPKFANPILGIATKAKIVGGMYDIHIEMVAFPLQYRNRKI